MSMPSMNEKQAVIKTMCGNSWTSLLVCSFLVHIISGHLSTMGKEFVVAVPKMRLTDGMENVSSIHFMLTTLSVNNVEVWVSTPHYSRYESNGASLNETLIVGGKSGVTYDLDNRFQNRQEVGHKWSYKFVGNATFSLCVLAIDNEESIATFQAIPVGAWGKKYVVVTLASSPSIQIVSGGDDNHVIFKFVVIVPRLSVRFFNYTRMETGGNISFTLRSDEAYSVAQCPEFQEVEIMKVHFTGSIVEATKPVGVVNGNCRTYAVAPHCRFRHDMRPWSRLGTDTVADMILAEEFWGTEFIAMNVPARPQQGYLQMVSDVPDTMVTFALNATERVVLKLMHTERFNFQSVPDYPITVTSNKPILLVHIQPPICHDGYPREVRSEPVGDLSLSLVVPTPLFHWAYIWMVPPLPVSHHHFVGLIAHKDHIYSISMDGHPIPDNVTWEHVEGGHDYQATMINTTSNSTSDIHTVVSKNYLRFGCYIYGHGTLFGYMHPAGFQACDTVTDKPKMTAGDAIDNDCDGHIDEEYENRKDDDSDGLIDEDTRTFRKRCPTPYTWGPTCERSCINCAEDCIEDSGACAHCKEGFKHSFGGCDNACEEFEYGKDCLGSCIDKCGRDCINRSTGECEACALNFTWGANCDQSCIHCIDDCDDVTGRCTRCHVGFKNAAVGCNKECEVNEYGEDCAGSCFHKCGGDCVDRRNGKCEQKYRTLLILLPCLLLVPLVFLCMLASKRRNRQHTLAEDALNVRRMTKRSVVSQAKA